MYNYPNEFIKIHSYDLSYISYFLKNVPKNAITEIFSLNKRNNHCNNIILTLTVANFTSVKDNGKMKGGSIIWNKKKKKEKKNAEVSRLIAKEHRVWYFSLLSSSER